MRSHKRGSISVPVLALAVLSGVSLTRLPAMAQGTETQQRVAEVKQASARNKQALATYTWQEQDTISLKGEVKKQESYQVRMGPDGKPQKMPLNPVQQAQSSQEQGGGHGGHIKQRVVEHKKEEYKEYAEKIGAVAHSYVPPDPAKLQQAFQQGNVKLAAGATPGQVQLVIASYLKPNDSMTITFDKTAKALLSVQIASYLDSPSDAVKVAVHFAKLADGTNHIDTMTLEGVSKQLRVAVQNSNYQHL
jgi:hypothetical protein